MSERPPILDHVRWDALSGRLDELAAARPDLAAACAAIRAPIDTIDRLWRDALPALGGDVLAVERLAALIAAAIPAAALVKTAHQAAEVARRTKLAEDHQPGLMRIGELAVLAVAAARVAPSGLVSMYAATIHGLALQAAPAEVLAHLEPYGPPRDTLGDLVARLVPPRIASRSADRLVLERFIYNRFELGRWHCLDLAFNALGFDSKTPGGEPGKHDLAAWSPATADRITRVAVTGTGEVVISGAFAWTPTDPPPIALGATAQLDAEGVPTVAVATGSVTAFDKAQITATFAQPVEWVGYALPAGIERARALRDRIRKRLSEIAAQPCVANDHLPALIADVPPPTAMTEAPPRRTDNTAIGGPAVSARLQPAAIVAGKKVTLSWESDGTDVQITAPDGSVTTGPASGTRTFTLATPGTAVFMIVARSGVLASPPRSVAVRVTAPATTGEGGDQPGEGDGDGEGEGDGEGDPRLTFVVFRPHVLDETGEARQVGFDESKLVVASAAQVLGVPFDTIELPWVEDGLAVVANPPHGCDDLRVTRLFEELDRAAARTPNREHAIWLALLPGAPDVIPIAFVPPQPAFGVARLAEAALAVVVANPAGLAPAIASLARTLTGGNGKLKLTAATAHRAVVASSGSAAGCASARESAARLRIIGAIDNHKVRLIDTPRLDKLRAAGPGAPIELGLVAVCCDADGRELGQTPIRGYRSGNAPFVALVPVTDDVARIELRLGDRTAMQIARPGSPPQLGPVVSEIDAGARRMSVRWRLAAGSALEAVLEAAEVESNDWVPITALRGCREANLAPTWRMRPNVVLRVVATDGWNVAEQRDPLFVPGDVQTGPFVIRRATDRLLWAELPDDAQAGISIWHVPQGAVTADRIVTLPPATQGEVELGITGIADIVDSFTIGSVDGQRRD
jgi:hypothetical protein